MGKYTDVVERTKVTVDDLARLMYRYPGAMTIMQRIAGKSFRRDDPRPRAIAMSLIAFSPTVKGNAETRRAKTIAVYVLARCALAQQRGLVREGVPPSLACRCFVGRCTYAGHQGEGYRVAVG